jgi:hypothetical protein
MRMMMLSPETRAALERAADLCDAVAIRLLNQNTTPFRGARACARVIRMEMLEGHYPPPSIRVPEEEIDEMSTVAVAARAEEAAQGFRDQNYIRC